MEIENNKNLFKKYWSSIIYIITSIILNSCANQKISAPISEVNLKNYNSNHITNFDNFRSYSINNRDFKTNVKILENNLNRYNYHFIKKGTYLENTYKVNDGDTLFYISWITNNDYRSLAKKNNILEPYTLYVGQILKINNQIEQNNYFFDKTNNINKYSNNFLNKKFKSTHQHLDKLNSSNYEYEYNNVVNNSKNIDKSNSSYNINIKSKSEKLDKKISRCETKKTIQWKWPTYGNIIEKFSYYEGGNKGIDISGNLGQPILSSANGKVVYVGNALRGYGNLIIIKHNDDYLSAYAHNDTLFVRKEQVVKQGQKISTMGSTGTNSVKLHFEIRYQGKSVNPLLYLPKRIH